MFGRDAAFVADATSFVLAAVLVFTIRRPMQAVRDAAEARRPLRPLADMKEGLHHAKEDPVLLALLSSKATFGLGAGTVGILAVLVTNDFAGGDAATGLMLAMRGIGVGLGPIIAVRLIGPSMSRLLRLCGLAGLVFGACYLGVSVAPTLAIATLFVLLAHLGGGTQWTMSTYGLQVRAPDEIHGRILAADFAFVTLILSVTTTAAGGLAAIVGPRPTIATFTLLGVLAGTTYLLLTRHLRRQLARPRRPRRPAGRRPPPRPAGLRRPATLRSAGQDLLDRLDEGERTDVAVEGRVHPVHHVGEHDLGLRVREGQRTAGAGVAERARPEHRCEHPRGHEPHAERRGEDEHLIGLVLRGDGRPGPVDRGRREQPHAVDLADRRGIEASERCRGSRCRWRPGSPPRAAGASSRRGHRR